MSVLGGNPLLIAGDDGYQISRSVRLRSSASAYFNRTPASAGNRRTFTISAWLKRGALGTDGYFVSVGTGTTESTWFGMQFANNDIFGGSAWATTFGNTTAVYRDPSAWYHLVIAIDTTQATAANRCKYYINGVLQTSGTVTVSQNADLAWNNSGVAHYIGARTDGGPRMFFDGLIADFYNIDGQALTPSSFGETDTITGVWKPKRYTGTYGTNGFYLNFSDNSNNTAATIGKDYSGNGNNWTPNNISVTSGVTYDSMLDVPTPYADGGNGRGNYAVLNPLKSAVTLSRGNLRWDGISSGQRFAMSSIGVSSGKWYFEAVVSATSGSGNYGVGIARDTKSTSTLNTADDWILVTGSAGGILVKFHNGSSATLYSAASSVGATIGVAFDVDAGKVWFSRNGTWLEGDPSAGTTPSYSDVSGTIQAAGFAYDSADAGDINFGQRPFAYTPPTGFVALNTQNLPDSTIKKGNQYFDATLYTGNGSTQSVSNSGSMQPDLVWVKRRNSAGSDHYLADVVRGATKQLISNSTAAEATNNGVTSFDASGFSVGAVGDTNANTGTFVGWQWKESASAGFDIVTYTGTGANTTIAHNLGVAPKMIIAKCRSAAGTYWIVGHSSLASWANYLNLNTTGAAGSLATVWNSTAPTASVFSLGSDSNINGSGQTNVAYLFAEVAGFSKFGSYTGNGSSDGPFVYCGFRPRFVLVKQSSGVSDWWIWDTSRETYNQMSTPLFPNTSGAEASNAAYQFDILSNGFKMRNNNATVNGSGLNYIYAAFAENPFKNSLAR